MKIYKIDKLLSKLANCRVKQEWKAEQIDTCNNLERLSYLENDYDKIRKEFHKIRAKILDEFAKLKDKAGEVNNV